MRVFSFTILVLAVSLTLSARAATPLPYFANPSGGEIYFVGRTVDVHFNTKVKAKKILLSLSRDGGQTFTDLGTMDVKTQLFKFTAAGPDSNNCVLRASLDSTLINSDVFTIVTVSDPNV